MLKNFKMSKLDKKHIDNLRKVLSIAPNGSNIVLQFRSSTPLRVEVEKGKMTAVIDWGKPGAPEVGTSTIIKTGKDCFDWYDAEHFDGTVPVSRGATLEFLKWNFELTSPAWRGPLERLRTMDW